MNVGQCDKWCESVEVVGGKEHLGKGNILNKIKKNVSRLLEGYKEKKKKRKRDHKNPV